VAQNLHALRLLQNRTSGLVTCTNMNQPLASMQTGRRASTFPLHQTFSDVALVVFVRLQMHCQTANALGCRLKTPRPLLGGRKVWHPQGGQLSLPALPNQNPRSSQQPPQVEQLPKLQKVLNPSA
jgi:hypothetical protein